MHQALIQGSSQNSLSCWVCTHSHNNEHWSECHEHTCVSQHPTTNQLFPGSAVDCTDRPLLLNITCDCSGCLSVSSTTCSASCFMWFEESRGHSRLVLIRDIAADSSGYLLLSDLTQQTCHGNYTPSQDELMCCKSKAPASECVTTCRVDSMQKSNTIITLQSTMLVL